MGVWGVLSSGNGIAPSLALGRPWEGAAGARGVCRELEVLCIPPQLLAGLLLSWVLVVSNTCADELG